jgi:hypothetical protein
LVVLCGPTAAWRTKAQASEPPVPGLFYARADVRPGLLGAAADFNSGQKLSGAGLSLGGDLMLGASLTARIAVGAALMFEASAAHVELTGGSVQQKRELLLGFLGPFIDARPWPSLGWHFGGAVGLARLTLQSIAEDPTTHHAEGYGAAFWLGHDFVVARTWSIGPLLKLTSVTAKDDDLSAVGYSIALGFAVLYH